MGMFDWGKTGVEVEQSDGSSFTRWFSDREEATRFAEDADGYGHGATILDEDKE